MEVVATDPWGVQHVVIDHVQRVHVQEEIHSPVAENVSECGVSDAFRGPRADARALSDAPHGCALRSLIVRSGQDGDDLVLPFLERFEDLDAWSTFGSEHDPHGGADEVLRSARWCSTQQIVAKLLRVRDAPRTEAKPPWSHLGIHAASAARR